mmetsp:Transcript_4132/g.11759  ORF Transcript_4132/g.11759 Transcript_4132/m.11759 type:complete len:303 (-) Transcript_4132:875-1783(-)
MGRRRGGVHPCGRTGRGLGAPRARRCLRGGQVRLGRPARAPRPHRRGRQRLHHRRAARRAHRGPHLRRLDLRRGSRGGALGRPRPTALRGRLRPGSNGVRVPARRDAHPPLRLVAALGSAWLGRAIGPSALRREQPVHALLGEGGGAVVAPGRDARPPVPVPGHRVRHDQGRALGALRLALPPGGRPHVRAGAARHRHLEDALQHHRSGGAPALHRLVHHGHADDLRVRPPLLGGGRRGGAVLAGEHGALLARQRVVGLQLGQQLHEFELRRDEFAGRLPRHRVMAEPYRRGEVSGRAPRHG